MVRESMRGPPAPVGCSQSRPARSDPPTPASPRRAAVVVPPGRDPAMPCGDLVAPCRDPVAPSGDPARPGYPPTGPGACPD